VRSNGQRIAEQGNFFQRQVMAVPEDMGNPLLKRWKKPDTNPFQVQASSWFWVLGRNLWLSSGLWIVDFLSSDGRSQTQTPAWCRQV
jgi:hypothetical protein